MSAEQALVVDVVPVREDFISAMRMVAGAVTVVTTGSGESVQGSTVSAFTSVTADPATVLVCLNTNNATTQELLNSGSFCVNVLAAHHENVSAVFAGVGELKGAQKFTVGCWQKSPCGGMALKDSLATFHCELIESFTEGSHLIVLGRVLAVDTQTGEPLVYFNRAYSAVTPKT
ncbi:flavin reductase family protein [Dasania marina]|uniref:flavin reductase family protein n=1 Tax=Dasania marina TaxID=471499 RepID=UPI00037565E8|nr:flavin reductase family protein [Dasania marina]